MIWLRAPELAEWERGGVEVAVEGRCPRAGLEYSAYVWAPWAFRTVRVIDGAKRSPTHGRLFIVFPGSKDRVMRGLEVV